MERLNEQYEEFEEREKKIEEEYRNLPYFSEPEPKTKENDYDLEDHFFRIAKYGDMDTWE